MPRKKHEIKSPKDLLPDAADLENDEMATEVDDVDIAPEDVAELEGGDEIQDFRIKSQDKGFQLISVREFNVFFGKV